MMSAHRPSGPCLLVARPLPAARPRAVSVVRGACDDRAGSSTRRARECGSHGRADFRPYKRRMNRWELGAPSVARPSLHFTAARGWINDPHGITVRNGIYHLFYQSAPGSMDWTPRVSWGHATSNDLVTWAQQQAVLVPDEDDERVLVGQRVR